MEISTKLLSAVLGFILVLIFGFWLGRKGRPYNGLLFNVHKLVALGTVILAALGFYPSLKGGGVEAGYMLLMNLAALCVIALFVSGALMSAGKGEYKVMKLVHNLAPVFGVLSMAGAVYLIL